MIKLAAARTKGKEQTVAQRATSEEARQRRRLLLFFLVLAYIAATTTCNMQIHRARTVLILIKRCHF